MSLIRTVIPGSFQEHKLILNLVETSCEVILQEDKFLHRHRPNNVWTASFCEASILQGKGKIRFIRAARKILSIHLPRLSLWGRAAACIPQARLLEGCLGSRFLFSCLRLLTGPTILWKSGGHWWLERAIRVRRKSKKNHHKDTNMLEKMTHEQNKIINKERLFWK